MFPQSLLASLLFPHRAAGGPWKGCGKTVPHVSQGLICLHALCAEQSLKDILDLYLRERLMGIFSDSSFSCAQLFCQPAVSLPQLPGRVESFVKRIEESQFFPQFFFLFVCVYITSVPYRSKIQVSYILRLLSFCLIYYTLNSRIDNITLTQLSFFPNPLPSFP